MAHPQSAASSAQTRRRRHADQFTPHGQGPRQRSRLARIGVGPLFGEASRLSEVDAVEHGISFYAQLVCNSQIGTVLFGQETE